MRGYNGDGISFQQSNDVEVIECTSEGNAVELGIHPVQRFTPAPWCGGCTAIGNRQRTGCSCAGA